jgi:hypothetical protein
MIHLDGFGIAPAGIARQLGRGRGLACLVLILVTAISARPAFTQVAESANAGGYSIWVGGGVSGYYLQYGGQKNLGITGYVDADSVRRLGIEAEGRWLDFHQTNNIHAETYLAGLRYHFNAGRFQPYAKGLAGLGTFNFTYNYAHGRYFVIAPGGGLDYRVNRRLSARADFEYQYWPQFTFGPMSSAGVSIGVRYLLLR